MLFLLLVCTFLPSDVQAQALGDLRLVDLASINAEGAGRLEIFARGEWGTVCDDFFGLAEGNVACMQLGYSSAQRVGNVNQLGYPTQRSENNNIWLDDVACNGSETDLLSCAHNSIGTHNCFFNEAVALVCTGASNVLPIPSFGDLRLVNSVSGNAERAGRLEIFLQGEWGTVCDNRFGIVDATVACRQLGFASAVRFGNVGQLGFAPGGFTRTWLENVGCSTSDTTLLSCGSRGIGEEDCNHSEDVAIVCSSPDEGDLRLFDTVISTGSGAGRLEIYLQGQWGTVCAENFDITDAQVACSQLGFQSVSRAGSVLELNFSPASPSVRTWLADVECTDSSTTPTLLSCDHGGVGRTNCSHRDDVALECSTFIREGELRLISSASDSSGGRLEIFLHGQWGTVCADGFGNMEGDVACTDLGYASASNVGTVRSLGYEPASTGTEIWLDNVDCSTGDSSLTSCNHRGFGVHDCTHSDDVAVVCSNSASSQTGTREIIIAVVVILVFVGLVGALMFSSIFFKKKRRVRRAVPPTSAVVILASKKTTTIIQAPPASRCPPAIEEPPRTSFTG